MVAGRGGFYYVRLDSGDILVCRARGRLKEAGTVLMVGDLVEVATIRKGEPVIEKVYPRKNKLLRPSVANLDQVLALMSIKDPPLDLFFLDRLLVQAEAAGLEVKLCLNKLDLADEKNLDHLNRIKETYEGCGYTVVFTSALTGEGVEELRLFLHNKVTVLAGPSGAGKSTLINCIIPGLALNSSPVSNKTRRGRHTTRYVELIPLEGDAYVVDSPGFQKLDLQDISSKDLAYFFPEIIPLGTSCRFHSCLHHAEPGCSVKAALEAGGLALWRYEHYLVFLQEVAHKEKKY